MILFTSWFNYAYLSEIGGILPLILITDLKSWFRELLLLWHRCGSWHPVVLASGLLWEKSRHISWHCRSEYRHCAPLGGHSCCGTIKRGISLSEDETTDEETTSNKYSHTCLCWKYGHHRHFFPSWTDTLHECRWIARVCSPAKMWHFIP